MTIIFLGDLVGKISRKALKQVLPLWREKYQPDFVLANGENLAHGLGLTKSTLKEILDAGVDIITTGDHAFDKEEAEEIFKTMPNVLRPANFPPGLPGSGEFLAVDNQKSLLVINLIGRVFLRQCFDCPFRKLDEILEKYQKNKPEAIVVDFHAEATSEKSALGWYANGRVSAVLGTHTHVGTVDTKILDKGTAFVSDVGMVGAVDSIIGAAKETVIKSLLYQTKFKLEPVENGECLVEGVLLEIEKTGRAQKIERIDKKIFIE
jgi:metallophosphoesterase (TIGR00282 family)